MRWIPLLLAACTPVDEPGTTTVPVIVDSAIVDTALVPGCIVGTGETAWQGIGPTGELAVTPGNQGLFHVIGSVVAWGIDKGNSCDPHAESTPRVRFQLVDESGSFAGYDDLPRPMCEDGAPRLIGETLVVWLADIEDAIGREATLEVEITDRDGVVVADAVPVVLVDGRAAPQEP